MSAPPLELGAVEKGQTTSMRPRNAVDDPQSRGDDMTYSAAPSRTFGQKIKKFEQQLVAYNLEARGIQRVEPHETHAVTWKSYVQTFLLWFSINLAANNITLGMLGPAVYALSFKDSSLCAVFGCLVGSIPVAYIATWGPVSGNRTLVCLVIVQGA